MLSDKPTGDAVTSEEEGCSGEHITVVCERRGGCINGSGVALWLWRGEDNGVRGDDN